jgi:amino-acid N-acetyltransferase
MKEHLGYAKAENIRNVLRYIDRFKNAVGVIYIDGRVIDSPLATSIVHDIVLIHQAGMQVAIVPGARPRIDEILSENGISWRMHGEARLVEERALPLIKMAAFDVSNRIMTSLAGEKRTALIGNWVRARRRGIIDGVDFGSAGEIDKINTDSVRTVLANGFIPIFPCIGWSAGGKPYNISSMRLATEVAAALSASKLFFVVPDAEVTAERLTIPPSIATDDDVHVPALNLEETALVIEQNCDGRAPEILELLKAGAEACTRGVERAHILNGTVDGVLPCEIFSDFGSGTMIYKSNYGGIRSMTLDDIPAVMDLMRPFVEKGILLPRTQSKIASEYGDYIVYELDGQIRASAALHRYDDGQCEIAAIAVNEMFSRMGTGPLLVSYLMKKAKDIRAKSVFVLTTQTADWFEHLGFVPADIATLPEKRRAKWTPERGSKLFRSDLQIDLHR